MPASKWPTIGARRDAGLHNREEGGGATAWKRRGLRPYIVRSWSRPPRGDAVSASSQPTEGWTPFPSETFSLPLALSPASVSKRRATKET